ncbi:GATOR2 complex protein WDR24-like isoform X2 [Corticium candelabrum]|uniref:GATOR2 complex protein WDR24-like isoform X2 n=1 Tax=Corticium candelabrum TaxID=121492 RepID=UPI002E2771AE|nr:GATOR2 complex protein WDR24-like isoform X2 [Corticium candelabrum]
MSSSAWNFQKSSSGVFGRRSTGSHEKGVALARTLTCDVSASMNALSTNRDCNMVVVAGRTVLKVFLIQDDGFEEKLNLRVGRTNLTFSSTDVQWHPTEASFIATAATNGTVVLWDLNKQSKSKQAIIYSDHNRTVNRVQFQADSNVLASGAQDGSIKLFDFRVNQSGAFKSLTCSSESVRDIKFNTFQVNTLAAAFENGIVQLWDLRNLNTYERQLTVHNGPTFCCDWNPEERHWLATAGRDKIIKVWDVQQTLVKEIYTVQTIASVARIKWRPSMKFQLASCALLVDNNINVWDVQRPYIPFACFTEHRDVTTNFIWHKGPDMLLSCSKDMTLIQHVFRDAHRPANLVPPVGLAVSLHGEISHAASDNNDGLKQVQSPASNLSRIGMFKLRKQAELTSPKDSFLSAHSTLYQFNKHSSSSAYDSRFEGEGIAHLARRYWLQGTSFEELCDHNAEVAKEVQLVNIASIWSMLKLLHSSESSVKAMTARGSTVVIKPVEHQLSDGTGVSASALDSKLVVDKLSSITWSSTVHKRASQAFGDTTSTSVIDGVEEEDDPVSDESSDDSIPGIGDEEKQHQLLTIASGADFNVLPEDEDISSELSVSTARESAQDWQLPSEAFQPREEMQSRSPSLHSPPSTGSHSPTSRDSEVVSRQLTRKNTVIKKETGTTPQMLDYPKWDHSQIVVDMLQYLAHQGDVQNAVSMALVLGDRLEPGAISEGTLEQWFFSYSELLQRFELWSIAAEIIKLCPLNNVNRLNLTSTFIATNCNTCRKPLLKSGWFCDRCQQLTNSCSICHETVKGLYVWCQGCGHGGHLSHIREWLSKSSWCPVGCGHCCEYT